MSALTHDGIGPERCKSASMKPDNSDELRVSDQQSKTLFRLLLPELVTQQSRSYSKHILSDASL